jgi:hypothetical protein
MKSLEPLNKYVSGTPAKSGAFWIPAPAGVTCSEFPYNNNGSTPSDQFGYRGLRAFASLSVARSVIRGRGDASPSKKNAAFAHPFHQPPFSKPRKIKV